MAQISDTIDLQVKYDTLEKALKSLETLREKKASLMTQDRELQKIIAGTNALWNGTVGEQKALAEASAALASQLGLTAAEAAAMDNELKTGQITLEDAIDKYSKGTRTIQDIHKAYTLTSATLKVVNKQIASNNAVVNEQASLLAHNAGSIDQYRQQLQGLTNEYNALTATEREGARGQELFAKMELLKTTTERNANTLNNFLRGLGDLGIVTAEVSSKIIKLRDDIRFNGAELKAHEEIIKAQRTYIKDWKKEIETLISQGYSPLSPEVKALEANIEGANKQIDKSTEAMEGNRKELSKLTIQIGQNERELAGTENAIRGAQRLMTDDVAGGTKQILQGFREIIASGKNPIETFTALGKSASEAFKMLGGNVWGLVGKGFLEMGKRVYESAQYIRDNTTAIKNNKDAAEQAREQVKMFSVAGQELANAMNSITEATTYLSAAWDAFGTSKTIEEVLTLRGAILAVIETEQALGDAQLNTSMQLSKANALRTEAQEKDVRGLEGRITLLQQAHEYTITAYQQEMRVRAQNIRAMESELGMLDARTEQYRQLQDQIEQARIAQINLQNTIRNETRSSTKAIVSAKREQYDAEKKFRDEIRAINVQTEEASFKYSQLVLERQLASYKNYLTKRMQMAADAQQREFEASITLMRRQQAYQEQMRNDEYQHKLDMQKMDFDTATRNNKIQLAKQKDDIEQSNKEIVDNLSVKQQKVYGSMLELLKGVPEEYYKFALENIEDLPNIYERVYTYATQKVVKTSKNLNPWQQLFGYTDKNRAEDEKALMKVYNTFKDKLGIKEDTAIKSKQETELHVGYSGNTTSTNVSTTEVAPELQKELKNLVEVLKVFKDTFHGSDLDAQDRVKVTDALIKQASNIQLGSNTAKELDKDQKEREVQYYNMMAKQAEEKKKYDAAQRELDLANIKLAYQEQLRVYRNFLNKQMLEYKNYKLQYMKTVSETYIEVARASQNIVKSGLEDITDEMKSNTKQSFNEIKTELLSTLEVTWSESSKLSGIALLNELEAKKKAFNEEVEKTVEVEAKKGETRTEAALRVEKEVLKIAEKYGLKDLENLKKDLEQRTELETKNEENATMKRTQLRNEEFKAYLTAQQKLIEKLTKKWTDFYTSINGMAQANAMYNEPKAAVEQNKATSRQTAVNATSMLQAGSTISKGLSDVRGQAENEGGKVTMSTKTLETINEVSDALMKQRDIQVQVTQAFNSGAVSFNVLKNSMFSMARDMKDELTPEMDDFIAKLKTGEINQNNFLKELEAVRHIDFKNAIGQFNELGVPEERLRGLIEAEHDYQAVVQEGLKQQKTWNSEKERQYQLEQRINEKSLETLTRSGAAGAKTRAATATPNKEQGVSESAASNTAARAGIQIAAGLTGGASTGVIGGVMKASAAKDRLNEIENSDQYSLEEKQQALLDYQNAVRETLESTSQMIGNMGKTVTDMMSGVFALQEQEMEQKLDALEDELEKTKEVEQEKYEAKVEAAEAWAEQQKEMLAKESEQNKEALQANAAYAADMARREKQVEIQKENEIALAAYEKDKAIAEGEYAVAVQRHALEKQSFENNKTLNMTNALIGAAQAIISCFSQLGPIAGAIAAIGVGVATGMQIAVISKSKYLGNEPELKLPKKPKMKAAAAKRGMLVAKMNEALKTPFGGLLQGKSHAEGGMLIEAEGGEAIINKKATAKYLPLLSQINQSEGGVPFTTAKLARGGVMPKIDTFYKIPKFDMGGLTSYYKIPKFASGGLPDFSTVSTQVIEQSPFSLDTLTDAFTSAIATTQVVARVEDVQTALNADADMLRIIN